MRDLDYTLDATLIELETTHEHIKLKRVQGTAIIVPGTHNLVHGENVLTNLDVAL